MEHPRITNVWATGFTDSITNKTVSRLIIEATSLPRFRTHVMPANQVRIDLPGSILTMAPASIPVNDGIISWVKVDKASSHPYVDVGLEHFSPWTITGIPGVSPGSVPKKIVMDFDRKPIRSIFEDRLIAIDPGHGGSDCGGRGPVSLVEKDITLKIGKLLGHALEQEGAGVVLTRTYDKDVSMQERFGRASDFGADILVSIHAFSSDDRKVSGARTLYCEDPTEKSLALAKCIHTSLVEKLPVANRQMSVSPMRLPNDFRIPYVVVEIAAITNWVDEGWLRNPTFRKQAANAMVTGLVRYFNNISRDPKKGNGDAPHLRLYPTSASAIPIRTHLIDENEDLIEVVKRYVSDITKPGDVVAIAESVVSITQGRAVLPESVRPGVLARMLCRLPGKGGSLATPPAMQLAIDEAGFYRILLGVAAGGVGRLMGRRGDFFRVAGHSLAQIDDIAGTLPPYDKHVILGPIRPEEVAEDIKNSIGVDVAIVDVNDLGCVDVLGITDRTTLGWVTQILAGNPLGNDNQQTPIVILRPGRRF